MLLLSSVLSDWRIQGGQLLYGLLIRTTIWTWFSNAQIASNASPPCSRGQPASHGSGVPPHCAAAEHALKGLQPDVHVWQSAAAAADAAGGGVVHPATAQCTS